MSALMKPLYENNNDWSIDSGDKSWIVNSKGNILHPLDPRPEEIDIEDIATALSREFRYANRTKFSVAQHCVLGARTLPGHQQLQFLMHDCEEAYLGDWVRPIKYDPRLAILREIGDHIRTKILVHFGIDPTPQDWIHETDARMLATEKRDLLPRGGNARWHVRADPYPATITPWLPDEARAEFLLLFRQLTNTLSPRREPRRRQEAGSNGD